MKHISIIHKSTNKTLLNYDGDIIPSIGDTYAGACFKDHQQRTITGRLLFPDAPNYITVYVDYTFPDLVLTETEKDLIIQQTIS